MVPLEQTVPCCRDAKHVYPNAAEAQKKLTNPSASVRRTHSMAYPAITQHCGSGPA
ncbi:hypothetical protein ACI01nite_06960 [Acetobacter cibinongensis]|uniref:Uncharacterized protein n=1 Tax=Acetobacter cibinongensis TaxID=146475 RepID=A0A0D6N3W8_9PROT|nr:hypothetical protein Abci_011_120 [Acetobacter cibinongensis]GBQ18660.1 hypothetical protein AA0482_2322 [Acetobacter cibinongensis NRIC 0482]GEL58094.1 hypothetical protein ACI01nite_06960 [Acetobacter cibinongensis]